LHELRPVRDELFGEPAGDLRYFECVRKPVVKNVALRGRNNLRDTGEPSQRTGVEDSVPIALSLGAVGRRRFQKNSFVPWIRRRSSRRRFRLAKPGPVRAPYADTTRRSLGAATRSSRFAVNSTSIEPIRRQIASRTTRSSKR
jgi:hypothetical protein